VVKRREKVKDKVEQVKAAWKEGVQLMSKGYT
jgi:FKBP-type peptidyl-prolyl cis-trans isomerase